MRQPFQRDSKADAQQRAVAKASLRESWRLAKKSGTDKLTDEEIDAEIALVRAELLRRRRKSPIPNP